MDPFKYREIQALFTARLPDSADSDQLPDRVPLNGYGTLRPNIRGTSVVFTEVGEFAVPRTRQVAFVDGELMVEVVDGESSILQPLFLEVTVDERANQEWSWTLTFDSLTIGEWGEEISHPALSFPVEEGEGPLELSAVATTVTRTANFVSRGTPGAGLQEITAADGEIVFSWDNGRTTTIDVPDAVPGLPGPEGPPGEVRFEGIDPGITVRTDDVLIGDTAVPSVEHMQENAYNKGIVLDGATLDALPTGAHWVDTTAAATSLGLPEQWRGSLNVVRRDGENATVEYTTRATPPRKYHTTRFSDGWRDWELVPRSTQATPTEDGLMSATDKARMRHTPQEVATPTDWWLAETDEDGKISRAVDAEGRTWLTPHPDTPGIADTRVAGQIQHVSTNDWAWAVADEAGQVALGVRPDGTTYTGGPDAAHPYDVILLAGQSNMQGAGRPLRDLEEWPTIWQYPAANKPAAGQIIPAVDPLQNPGTTGSLIAHGPGLFFAREYAIRHPGRRVLLVPAAYSGTAFSSDLPNTWDWTAGAGNLAARAVEQTLAAIAAAGDGARLAAILWHQGEGDTPGSAAPLYKDRLSGFITWIRDQLDTPDVPFVIGQMAHDRKGTSEGSQVVDRAHMDMQALHEVTGFARTRPAMSNPGDLTHLSARGQILMGEAMYAAWQRARFNSDDETAPIGVENLTARRVGDHVHVTWDESWSRVTSYAVEWSTDTSTWQATGVEQFAPLACEATLPAQPGVMQVRVTATNPHGTSTPYVIEV